MASASAPDARPGVVKAPTVMTVPESAKGMVASVPAVREATVIPTAVDVSRICLVIEVLISHADSHDRQGTSLQPSFLHWT
jgi:hypothetical protein